MTYRKESGEEVTKDSWLIRNLWDVTTPRGKGVTIPKKLKSSGVKRLMERALWAQGLEKNYPSEGDDMNSKRITALEYGSKQGAKYVTRATG